MQTILDTFTNRELALIIWLTLALFASTLRKDIRESLGQLLKGLFARKLFTLFALLTLYVFGTILALHFWGLWDISLLKDTLFWFFTVALVLYFNVHKAKDTRYFKNILTESFKWTIVIEFLVNFYTFSLVTELIMLPILILVSATQAVSETAKQHESVNKFLTNILALIGLSFFLFALYKTVETYQEVFTVHNLHELLLPAILTILFLPFIYFVAVYMNYETLFIRINFVTEDAKLKKALKKEILFAANLNLNRLKVLSDNLRKFNLEDIDDLKSYIRSLTK